MNARSILSRHLGATGLLLLLGLMLWAWMSWPLPRFFNRAIPFSHRAENEQIVRPLAPGDHLQLLYHFWLGLDALGGHSPLFHNVYEFNLGDDSTRRQPDLYYLPFSAAYAALAPRIGHAGGWNAAGLASVLVGVLGIGFLARRFNPSPWAWLLITALAGAMPYRWITLFGGSPTGFAMALPPWFAYGLDRAIRDRSPAGGLLAGLALLFSYTADLHVFYFTILIAPLWALISFHIANPSWRTWPHAILKLWSPLLPLIALTALAVVISVIMSRHLGDTVMAGGRRLSELAAYSPKSIGLIATASAGMTSHVYVGIPFFLLLLVSVLFWLPSIARRKPARPATSPQDSSPLAIALLLAALALLIILALGTNSPGNGAVIRLARKIVPKYSMIRQTVKIFCWLPPLVAVLLALLWKPCCAATEKRTPARPLMLALILLLSGWSLWQSHTQIAPQLCRLPAASRAYEAVAQDDKANAGRPAHALAIPLWPGNSHWTSLCEYHVMLSRVRLVNGYAPAVPAGYLENVFRKYESLNQGVATDAQLDSLLAMGVRHLILHTTAFPPQVSPFPPAATLRALVRHPRLAPLADDGQTFAFRILPKHPIEHTPHANWPNTLFAANRTWNWTPPLEIPSGQSAPLLFRAPLFTPDHPRYLLQLAAPSTHPLLVPPGADGVASLTRPIPGLPDWLQADLPTPLGAQITAVSGPVSLHAALLTAGELPAPDSHGRIHIPPALMFHTAHATPGQDAIHLTPETVPAGLAWHGPNLPFPPGVYDIRLEYTTKGPRSPGHFQLTEHPSSHLLATAPLDPAANQLTLPAIVVDAAPLRFELHYNAQAPLTLKTLQLTPATITLQKP